MGKHEIFQESNYMLFCLCNIYYRIIKKISLIHGSHVGIVCRITLKPRVSLYELFYLFVLKFILSTLKLLFAQDKKIKFFLDNDRILLLNIF